MMNNKSAEPNQLSNPLLSTDNVETHGGHDDVDFEGQRQNGACSVPTTLILSTLVAVLGSYVFGSAVRSHVNIMVSNIN